MLQCMGSQRVEQDLATEQQLFIRKKGNNAVQIVKNLPVMQETWVRFLGLEDSLEEEMTIHSNILTWRIPWTEEPGGLQSMGSQRVGHN